MIVITTERHESISFVVGVHDGLRLLSESQVGPSSFVSDLEHYNSDTQKGNCTSWGILPPLVLTLDHHRRLVDANTHTHLSHYSILLLRYSRLIATHIPEHLTTHGQPSPRSSCPIQDSSWN